MLFQRFRIFLSSLPKRQELFLRLSQQTCSQSRGTAVLLLSTAAAATAWDVQPPRDVSLKQLKFASHSKLNDESVLPTSRQQQQRSVVPLPTRLLATSSSAAAAGAIIIKDADNEEDTPSATTSSVDNTSSVYQRVHLPPLVPTHAVVSLLHHGNIQSWQVFRNTNPASDDDEILLSVVELGTNLDGHVGVVHGGILALLMDDALGLAVMEGLRVPFAVTANLNIDYRHSVPSGSTICIRCKLVERKERKLVWKVLVESYEAGGESKEPTLYCEAISVFVIPRQVYKAMNHNA
jgi:acyl-coenzyme A thioesterase PaaI-like protein